MRTTITAVPSSLIVLGDGNHPGYYYILSPGHVEEWENHLREEGCAPFRTNLSGVEAGASLCRLTPDGRGWWNFDYSVKFHPCGGGVGCEETAEYLAERREAMRKY